MRTVFVLGRMIFGGFFAYSGFKHLQHRQNMGQYAASKGVPASEPAVQASGALLLAGGVSVMMGFRPHQGLAAIVAFLVPSRCRCTASGKRRTRSVVRARWFTS